MLELTRKKMIIWSNLSSNRFFSRVRGTSTTPSKCIMFFKYYMSHLNVYKCTTISPADPMFLSGLISIFRSYIYVFWLPQVPSLSDTRKLPQWLLFISEVFVFINNILWTFFTFPLKFLTINMVLQEEVHISNKIHMKFLLGKKL